MSAESLERLRKAKGWDAIKENAFLGILEDLYRESTGSLKPLIVARYEELLQKVTSVKDLDGYHSSCPGDLEFLVAARYEELLPEYVQQVSSYKELDLLKDEALPGDLVLMITKRFTELLPDFLQQDRDSEEPEEIGDLEVLYDMLPNHLRPLVSDYYKERLQQIISLEDLEERSQSCPGGLKSLVIDRYGELLQQISSVEDLRERMRNCPNDVEELLSARYEELLPDYLKKITSWDDFEILYEESSFEPNPLILDRQKELLQEVVFPKELGDIYEQQFAVASKFLISARYKELLQQVVSMEELEELYKSCPFDLGYIVLARYKELLSEYLQKGVSLEELEERYDKCSSGMKHLYFVV